MRESEKSEARVGESENRVEEAMYNEIKQNL